MPDELLESLESPSGFFVEKKGDKLILDPVTPAKLEKVTPESESLPCQLCGHENSPGSRFCDNCGSFITKFKLFLEE